VLRGRDGSRLNQRRALDITPAHVPPSCCSGWVSEYLALPWHFPMRERPQWEMRGEVGGWHSRSHRDFGGVSPVWWVSWRRASLLSFIQHHVPKFGRAAAS